MSVENVSDDFGPGKETRPSRFSKDLSQCLPGVMVEQVVVS